MLHSFLYLYEIWCICCNTSFLLAFQKNFSNWGSVLRNNFSKIAKRVYQTRCIIFYILHSFALWKNVVIQFVFESTPSLKLKHLFRQIYLMRMHQKMVRIFGIILALILLPKNMQYWNGRLLFGHFTKIIRIRIISISIDISLFSKTKKTLLTLVFFQNIISIF